jgi:cephalosporin hydroxylase
MSSKNKIHNNPLKRWFSRLITVQFHKLYYHSRPKIWNNTYWLGTSIGKCPFDLWNYQEIIYELRPDVIIEAGTGWGGSTLFFASCCDLIGNGRIISIDISDPTSKPQHDRITYLQGSSTSTEIVNKVKSCINDKNKVLVNLDSDHTMKHVLEELNIYSEFVTPGSYIIVEDTCVGGHPVKKGHFPGPMEAVMEFVKHNSSFTIDKTREKFMLTFNPNGYLKKNNS